MEHHPIRRFIDQIFPGKEQEKRAKWAQYFIDEEYDDIEQLKKFTEAQWDAASKAIPSKIITDIKENLSKSDGRLSSEDKKQLSSCLNEGLSPQQILKIFRETENTPKGLAIMNEIKSLIKPPKPQPAGCKRVGVKLKQQTLPLYYYKGKKLQFTKYYTLLVVGETGSGKTTLLDAFVNKLTGMEFTDNWRWKLVDQDHLKDVPSGKSQTSQITTYYVNDVHNRFNIRIIDTPGFGDTKGIQVDDQTVQKFESLFSNIPEIDYVLLTVKSTETRLRPGSKYVYNRVQQIFGVDAKDRFMLMCTFAQGATPLCIQTFQQQNLHFEKYFPFNNSAIYTPSGTSNTTTSFFWKMGVDSIQNFQDYIIKADKSPLSLKLSREVLQARKYLEQSIKTSQDSFVSTCSELDVAKRNLKNWKQNKKQIEQNGCYTEYQTVTTFPYTNLGKTVQMCNICKITCCQVCTWPQNQTYSACTYFRIGNGCPLCPGKCSRYNHVRTNDYITKVVETKPIVIDCKKKAYEQGVTLAQTYQTELNKNLTKLETLAKNILHHGNEIKENLKKLEEIALQPRLWTDQDFYDQMIAQEEDRKEDGWVDRVAYLKETLGRIKMLQKIQRTANIQDLFPELKTLKDDIEDEKSEPMKKITCEIY